MLPTSLTRFWVFYKIKTKLSIAVQIVRSCYRLTLYSFCIWIILRQHYFRLPLTNLLQQNSRNLLSVIEKKYNTQSSPSRCISFSLFLKLFLRKWARWNWKLEEIITKNKAYSKWYFMMVEVCSVNRLYSVMLRIRKRKNNNNSICRC